MAETAPKSRKGRPTADETARKIATVLETARAEFAAHGYRATSMDTIAKKADVSKRSLYLWYADKAALFSACIQDQASKLPISALDERCGLEEALRLYGSDVLRVLSTEEGLAMGGLMIREGPYFPEVLIASDQSGEFITEPVETYLHHRGVAPKRASRLAFYFFSMLLQNHQHRLASRSPPISEAEIKSEVAEVVGLFVHGLVRELPSEAPKRSQDVTARR
jgi:TetR/AcrR family transcriptional regulator, mexJK operon transcriptional repressor